MCSDLGSGWRLPSITELKLMYLNLHAKNVGNFKHNQYYWSDTMVDANNVKTFNMIEEYLDDCGFYEGDKLDSKCYVRAVKTI